MERRQLSETALEVAIAGNHSPLDVTYPINTKNTQYEIIKELNKCIIDKLCLEDDLDSGKQL